MPAPVKERKCLKCFTTDPIDFCKERKTLCKLCVKTGSFKENRELILTKHCCVVCGTEDIDDFYPYKKNRCKEHFHIFRGSKLPTKVKIRIITKE